VHEERITMRWASGRDDDLQGALRLREEVFCLEQGVPREEELDGLDHEALHLLALDHDSGRVIGTLRLLLGGTSAKIGRVAVDRAWRRRGIASRMLAMVVDEARQRGCARARLAAQVDALTLYEQAGFSVESEPFEEAGITHVWMGRTLGRPPSAPS
jgi:predicted GNAT family N-acyltransferase